MGIEEFITNQEKAEKKAKVVSEDDIEGDFVKYARRNGCKAVKLVLLRLRGFPDRTVLIPGGKVLFIEFKKLGGKLTTQQKKWVSTLRAFGFRVHICDKKGQAERVLDSALET